MIEWIRTSQLSRLERLVQKYRKDKKRKEYALVSKKDNKRVLKWFGIKKPSKGRVLKEERRVQFFKHK